MIFKSPAQAGGFHLSKNFYSLRVFFDKCFHSSPKLSTLLTAMRPGDSQGGGFSAAPLEPASSQCSCRDKNIASGGTSARAFIEGRPKAPFSRFRTISPDTLLGIFLSCLFPRSGTPGKLSPGILDRLLEKHYNVASALFSETARFHIIQEIFLWQSPFPATPAAFN